MHSDQRLVQNKMCNKTEIIPETPSPDLRLLCVVDCGVITPHTKISALINTEKFNYRQQSFWYFPTAIPQHVRIKSEYICSKTGFFLKNCYLSY